MPSKTFLVKSNNDSCNFPGSPTLSKSTVALGSHGTVPGIRSPQGHRSPSPLQRGKRFRCVPGLPDEPRRLGLRRPSSLASRRPLYARLERRRSPRPRAPPRPACNQQQPRQPGARTSAPGTSREAPPTWPPSPTPTPQQLAKLRRGSSIPAPPLPEADSQGLLSSLPSAWLLQLLACVPSTPLPSPNREDVYNLRVLLLITTEK